MILRNKREDLFWKVIQYPVYIFVFTFPFINFNSFLYGGSSTRSINLILLTILLGISFCIYLFKSKNELSISKSPVFISISIYFLSILVSTIFGLNPYNSFWSVATRTTGVWYFIHLGMFIYILWALLRDIKKQDLIIKVIMVSATIFSILCLVSPEGLNVVFKGYISDGFTFRNSSFAAMYIFGSFLLSLYYLLQSEKKKWWMYVVPTLIILNPLIINTSILVGNFSDGLIGEARATSVVVFMSPFFLAFIWLISKIKNSKTRDITAKSLFGISIFAIIFIAISLLSSDGYLRKIYLSQATGARPLVWEMSQKVISEKPFFGWGTDNFEKVFESNYDNRLLQNEYGNEAWFDRAHNVFIDQLVDNGYVGLVFYILIYLVIVYTQIYVTLKSSNKKDRVFSSILIVYFTLHLIELQTAFDTSISYLMVAIMIAFSAALFDRTRSEITKVDNEWDLGRPLTYAVSGITLVFLIWSLCFGWFPFVRAQLANAQIRTSGSSEARISQYQNFFASPVDKYASIWRTSTDFKIAIGANPKVLSDSKNIPQFEKEMVVFEKSYRSFIKENPDSFRARLNLADMLIYQSLFGVNKLAEAQSVLDEAIKIVPQAPQSYWMKAVCYVYMKKFDLAREYAKKGIELNPKIKQSQLISDYVEKSIKDFPNIDLYFFKQI